MWVAHMHFFLNFYHTSLYCCPSLLCDAMVLKSCTNSSMARVTSPAGPHLQVSHGACAILREILTDPPGRDLHDFLKFCTDSESIVHVYM